MRARAGISRITVATLFMGMMGMLWLMGCQSLAQRDMGRLVPDFYRVAIPDEGTAAKTFKTNDMTIDYQYRKAGDQLKIWGSGTIRYDSINELVFHLYFLDGRGEVIGIHNFYSFLDHSDFMDLNLEKRQVHRDFTIPAGAVAFAIGYDGETGRTPGHGVIVFSHNPFH